jgi:DNA polymerase-3 subunit alpha
MSFVHLHTHSHYSLLDGLTKIDELIEVAKKDNAPAVALTDHGVMYGVIEFYQKCRKAGIKPIIGVEAYMAPESRLDKARKENEKNYYHILLLAKNLEGYKNLIKLTSIAHLEGYYYKPRIDWEVLTKHSAGLIAATACLGGEIPRLILSNKIDRAKQRILEYQELFGVGNFYLEIMPHQELPGQPLVNKTLIKLSRELKVPLIATGDIHYLRKEDEEAQDILLCLQNKKKKEDTDRMNMTGVDYSFKTETEMRDFFHEVPEALDNTVKIAEMCNLEIELGITQLPYFEVPPEYDGNSYLRKLCEEGLIKRYGKKYEAVDKAIKERMDYELSVVTKMGWPDYFLIVADFVNWAKSNDIVVGPGRGSAAGSLVCYLIGITNLDPLKYDLLFERFLNPDRVSMPDIDMDFADTRRDEVLRYVEEKYGKDHVSQIITFGTMAARAAIRDVGRVLNYPYDYCDRLAKMVPPLTKLNKALETVNELREIYENETMAKTIINYARALEGVARHASTHACGVVITKDPLVEYTPVQFASSSDRTIVSQYSLHPIEDLGLLKMDFLGLKNLTLIESAIKIIKNTRGIKIDIDKLPLDDKDAYKLFQDGETTGVFQFESSGMKRYLRELKSTEFEDIIAMVALYRPGPMEWIPDYIAGKHKTKKPVYLHSKLEPILSKTYGVAIYQEQVMQMARDLAGFTMAEADVLRKAVGKKIIKLLEEQKEKFVSGCEKNGINKDLGEKIWAFIEPFAGYGFNRSHAACYAMIAYQTAYLKARWPVEFMAALLTSDQQDTERLTIEIEEARRMGIEVKQPDINQSFGSFTVVTKGTEENSLAEADEELKVVRFGLKAIKNMGEHISEVIIKERKENGPYKDITDFLSRITDKDLNKKSLDSLIKGGGLDQFGERGELLANMDSLLNFSKEINNAVNSKQTSLFAQAPALNIVSKVRIQSASPAKKQDKLKWEKELLGVYITEHPFSDYRKFIAGAVGPLSELTIDRRGQEVRAAGIIVGIKKIMTRNNETMIFAKIEDQTKNVEALVFPRLYKETIPLWQEGKAMAVFGTLSDKDQDVKLLINIAQELTLDTIEEDIKKFKNAVSTHQPPRKNFGYNSFPSKNNSSRAATPVAPIKTAETNNHLKLIFDQNLDPEILNKLRELFAAHPGQDKVYIKINNGAGVNIVETAFRVANSQDLVEAINKNFGEIIKIA